MSDTPNNDTTKVVQTPQQMKETNRVLKQMDRNVRHDFDDIRVHRRVKKMLSEGKCEGAVAKLYRVSNVQWRKLKAEYPRLNQAVEDGIRDVNSLMHDELFKMVMDPDNKRRLDALKYFTQTRLGWSIGVKELEKTLSEFINKININIVEGKDPKKFAHLLNNDINNETK